MARKPTIDREVLAVKTHLLREEEPEIKGVDIMRKLGISNNVFYSLKEHTDEITPLALSFYHRLMETKQDARLKEKELSSQIEELELKQAEIRSAIASLSEDEQQKIRDAVIAQRKKALEVEKKEHIEAILSQKEEEVEEVHRRYENLAQDIDF